jgi:hypothetical protein
MRLGGRIFDLRAEGYEIEERRVEGTAYGEYRLKPGIAAGRSDIKHQNLLF